MRLRNLLRLRRWALVAQVGRRKYEVWSWHLTYTAAVNRRRYHHMIHATRDTALWVYSRRRLDDLPGEVVQ
jgi:hypothetical protein